MKPEVYFSSIKEQSRNDCLRTLLKHMDAVLSQFQKGSFVGIKMTVGDKRNTGHIKPELVKILVENLKRRGAKPFVFDTNVIYRGQRQNAVDHLNLAYQKGFTPEKLGCPYIIADGIFGTDSKTVRADFRNIKEIRVPSFIGVLEDLIVLSHITGHIMTGYAASIKNVGMGMASRAGKQVQHSSMKPVINVANCALCGCCIESCPVSAVSEVSGKAFINSKACIGCGECIACCKFDAVQIHWHEDENIFAERMVEYAQGILSHIRRKLFINFLFDITEECDCIAGSDPKIAEDAGIVASTDILAADKAAFDIIAKKADIFSRDGKIKAHRRQFGYGEEIGLGHLDYGLKAL
ncbi:MAG: DUF362 domain-containing protein [Nitrospiraceae bacterium]|nr:MAG: DUF362 domain-containing protein [Nitrospiraceae bacterium]